MQSKDLSAVWAAAREGRMKDLRYRQRQLISLHKWLTSHADEIEAGIQKDARCTSEEARLVLAKTVTELRQHYDGLDLKKELRVEYSIKEKQSCPGRQVAPGIVYVIPERFTLFFSVLSAVTASIEAGNCCIVELGNDLSSSPALLRRCISEALDPEAFAITSSTPHDFLAQCLVLDQTGASKTPPSPLTSSPSSRVVAIVDRTADIALAAREIVCGRFAFAAQSPYAPDCVLVNEFVEEAFLQAVAQEMTGLPDLSNGHAHHHNTRKVTRDDKMLDKKDQNGNSIWEAGQKSVVRTTNRKDPRLHRKNSSPILLVRPYTSLDDAIDSMCLGDETFLALYVFAAPAPAKYLAQFFPTAVSFVNHIPGDMLVGPAGPLHFPISTAVRYTKDMFQTPRPQFVRPTSDTAISAAILNRSSQQATQFYDEALKPLSPTGQPEGHDKNFFIMGLQFAAVVYVLPVLAAGLAGTAWIGMLVYSKFR